MNIEKEVKSVMSELQSGRGSSLYSALIMLRTTLIKSRPAVTQLVTQGAIKLMIRLLEERRRHVNQTRTTDIVMSILANLCMEADVRAKMMNSDGLDVIARVTLSAELESIQNRGIRAIANLAQDVTFREKIIGMEVPAFVAKKLMETEDGECQATYCRALRLLGQSDKGVKRLVEDTQAVQALAGLLKLDNKKLTLKSLRILSEFSALRCCGGFTGQILAANVLEELVTFADDDDNDVAFFALSIIFHLCEQELMRPALGSAGAISLLVKHMSSEKSFVDKVSTLNALCLCTKEAVNRKKIFDCGGLEILVSALDGDEAGNILTGRFSVLYDRIISSLVNFLYNDDCFCKLLDLGLVKVLLRHLKRCCQFTCSKENLRDEIGLLAKKAQVIQNKEWDQHETSTISNTPCEENLVIPVEKSTKLIEAGEDLDNMVEEIGNDNCLPAVKADTIGTEQLYIDPLIIDANRITNSDGVVVEDEVEEDTGNLSSSDGTVELPLPPSTMSRNTFSINSPTYQAETSWKIEDYTTGVTCKTFTPEQDGIRNTSHSPSYHLIEGSIQSPYSPLSASASYYSPAHSSPSHSASLSPMQSLSPRSPASGSSSNQGSPTWSLNSTGLGSPNSAILFSPQQTSPSHSLHSPYQNQFSPLSNVFPSSPLQSFAESGGQSPIFNSQMSLFSQSGSQESSVLSQEQMSNVPVSLFSEHLGQGHDLLSSSQEDIQTNLQFSIVPLSQDNQPGESPVYSASEEDDIDDDYSNDGSNVQKILEDQSRISQQNILPAPMTSGQGIASQDNPDFLFDKPEEEEEINNSRKSVCALSNRKHITFSSSSKTEINISETDNSNKHSDRTERESENIHGKFKEIGYTPENISKTCRHSSVGFTPSLTPTDLDEDSVMANDKSMSSSQNTLDEKEKEICFRQGDVCQNKEIQRSNSSDLVGSVTESHSKDIALKHLHSYPGKRKLTTVGKSSYKFMRRSSPAVSPITSHGSVSPHSFSHQFSRHGVSPLISDSPYRSPIPDFREEIKGLKLPNINLVEKTETSVVSLKGKKSCETPAQSTSGVEPSCSSQNPNIESSSASISRSNQHEARVKKILKTSEFNILILLSRISIKTNPTHFLADSPTISCLLTYLSSASNPSQRCCRILNRLCSNLLSFEKLMLIQAPAMIVRSLVLEEDGTFPNVMFCNEWENQFGILQRSRMNLSDLLPSSQSSEVSGSQASEFGRKMDFEFGSDAYSRINHPSLGAVFRNQPSLSVDSQAARDSGGSGGDVYEAGSSRTEVRVRLGLGLVRTLGSVAMSRYGEGEIQHLLTRRPLHEMLACIISLLYLPVGWGHFTRRQFISKYNLWEKILPYVFISEGPLAREAIVMAISLNLHLDNPSKKVEKIDHLLPCLDIVKNPRVSESQSVLSDREMGDDRVGNVLSVHSKQISLDAEKTESDNKMSSNSKEGCSGSSCNKETCEERENTIDKNTEKFEISDNDIKNDKRCPYEKLSLIHDVIFQVEDGKDSKRLAVNREIMTQKSEVFAAMLGGSYAESNMSEILIHDVNPAGFEFVAHYLHGCTAGCLVIDSFTLENLRAESLEASATNVTDRDQISSGVNVQFEIIEKNKQEKDLSFDSCHQRAGEENDYPLENMPQISKEPSLISSNEASKNQEDKDSRPLKVTKDSSQLSYPSDCLTIGNTQISGQGCLPFRKLNFDKTPETWISSDMREKTEEKGEKHENELKHLENLVNKYADLMTLADRFLLKELMDFVSSVLSHVCLTPQTCEEIFYLACFYKLDLLAIDCIRGVLMSHLPCHEMTAILSDLGDSDYKEQASSALSSLLHSSVTH